MKKLILVAAAFAALLSLHGNARAGYMEYMTKTKPADKAVMAAIIVIFEKKCDEQIGEKWVTLKNLLVVEQAYSKKQATEAVKNQAAFFVTAGKTAWCSLAAERLAE